MQRFKDIPGWPGYRVSRDGVVQSCRINSGKLSGIWRAIAVCVTRDGYQQVSLWNRQFHRLRRVHTLVLTTFIGPAPQGKQCRHRNGNRSDNRLKNLCWGTPQQNMDDRTKHGKTSRGESAGRAKLTEGLVLEIRRMRASGKTLEAIAKAVGVSRRQVGRIYNRQAWTHI